MSGALVDVCIPTHRDPKLLEAAIASVRAQTHTDWRLVVGIDREPGDALAVALERVARAGGAEVVVGRVGAAANMTRLLRAGDAPYAILLHDDDLWLPTMLERRVAFLDAHPRAGLVSSTPQHVDGDGRPIRRHRPRLPAGEHGRQTVVSLLLRRNTFLQSATLIRRSTFVATGDWLDHRFPRLFDWEHALRLALAGPSGYLTAADVLYRRHPAQMSVDRTARLAEFDELQDHLDRLVAERAPELRLDPNVRRRVRARGYLGVALDIVGGEAEGSPLRLVGRAVRIWPRILLDPGTPAAVLGAVAGRRLRGVVARLRGRSRTRGWLRGA